MESRSIMNGAASYTSDDACSFMTQEDRAYGPAYRALLLSTLMVLSTVIVPGISAENESARHLGHGISGQSWDLEGSEDTGWVQLDALGADSLNGMEASAKWNLEFAPGATLDNLTFEVRVDGANGLSINEPLIIDSNTLTTLFDWQGMGTLGKEGGFDIGNPYSSRLTPNANSNAGWSLPAGSEITDLVIEALAPSDPYVAFSYLDVEFNSYAIHPVDGRMYLGIGETLAMLDSNNDPPIIDLMTFEGAGGIPDLELDVANDRLYVVTYSDGVHSIALSDSSTLSSLPGNPGSDQIFSEALVTPSGDLMICGSNGLFSLNSAGTGWTMEAGSGSTDWPTGYCMDLFIHNGIIYAPIWEGGVARWDLNSGSTLSAWTSDNLLPSNYVNMISISGSQLLIATYDGGISRYDTSGGFWLSDWNDGNWLASNYVTGMNRIADTLYILAGEVIHHYNTTSGIFSSSTRLDSLGLGGDGVNMMHWPAMGSRSPSNDSLLIGDGSGVLAMVEHGANPFHTGDIVIGSGPSNLEMSDAVELDNILWVSSLDKIDRFDIRASRWLAPLSLSDTITTLQTDGVAIYAGTDGGGLYVFNSNGTSHSTWGEVEGLASNRISHIAFHSNRFILGHFDQGISVVDFVNNSVITHNTDSGLLTNTPTDIETLGGIAFIGSENQGLGRYDIGNDTFLSNWVSTGINDVDFAPVAVYGTNPQILHLGLPGYGVVRKNLQTGEILIPLTEEPNRGTPGPGEVLPSDQIFALDVGNNGLYIGTGNGAVVWNGNSATELSRGGSWNLQPSQHFGFAFDSTNTYSATNIGICKYVQTTMSDCVNAQDGMPNWGVYSIGINSTTVFGGTLSGVGLVDKATFTVSDTWETGEETENALVEVIGDVAYVGLYGIGIARYDLQNQNWLTIWTEDNVLDPGNGDVTGIVADFRPNHLWIGGTDGFQLINVTTGAEVYDIEKTSSLWDFGNGDPYDLAIYGDTLYYHQQYSSDSVFRIDIANFTSKSTLDAGAQVDENGGDVYGMEIIGDLLHVSVASGQWWNTEGSGGIAIYNLSSDSWEAELLPDGSVNRVTSFESSTGNMWISWGESKLEAFDSNGNSIGQWENLDFPIRQILEYNNEILFATEEGVARYNESSGQWLSTWTDGNGLPSSADDIVYDLWTNGTDLVVTTARNTGGWNGLDGEIMHLDSSGTWTSWDTGSNGIPNGYPIGMVMCDGLFHVAITANNGGVARFDLANSTVSSSFTSQRLDDGNAAALACDEVNNILYVGYNDDQEPISRYDYNNGRWLSSLTSSSHNIPSDPVWWGAMHFSGGKLIVGYDIGTQGSNVIGGGCIVISTNGAAVGNTNVVSTGSAVTSIDLIGSTWLLGTAGGTSGYSSVDTLGQLGFNTIYSLPNLVSGQVTSIAGNQTHLWVASSSWQNSGSGLLQGERLANGSVEWQNGWTIPANAAVTDIKLVGDELYLASNNRGLRLLNTSTGILQTLPTGLHNFQDGMKLVGNDLVIGLQGTGSSSAGVQVFNTTTKSYTAGRLLSGLPSNSINGFLTTVKSSNIPSQPGNEMIYIATDSGVGRWNATDGSWETAWTTLDGLPTSNVEDIIQYWNETIWLATPSGLSMYDEGSNSFTTYKKTDGLMGTSTWGLYGDSISSGSGQGQGLPSLFIAHDGRGTERPGVTQINAMTQTVITNHQFDQLPSNNVLALEVDSLGLYIATDESPIIRWNSVTRYFEDGPDVFEFKSWPVTKLVSDNSNLIAIGNSGLTIVSTSSLSVTKSFVLSNVNGGTIGANGLWLTTDDGLYGWYNTPAWTPMERGYMRRAMPLNIGFQSAFNNVSMYAHPGMGIDLLDGTNVTLDSGQGSASSHGILMQAVPLVVSSTVDNAAFWVKSRELNYTWTHDIASTDPTIETSMQFIIDNGQLINGTRHAQLELRSPTNGSIWVRLTYDWIRNETPVEIISLDDRPDDGGNALVATWSVVNDEDFARYLIFVRQDGWATDPTAADLLTITPDASISIASRVQSDLTTAGGLPIVVGLSYRAVIVVEYAGGRMGTPSAQFGPAIPTDEMPMPPLWATGTPAEDGEIGDLFLEWSKCTALDLASTEIYYSTTPFTDAIGLTLAGSIIPAEGNQTILSLEAGKPHWFAFTCVDQSGQEDILNATIIGPIVPTGGLNDNTPPPALSDVWAEDVPNDEGGRVRIGWEPSSASDCSFVTIWMIEARIGEEIPTNVDGFSEATIVPDCETNMTVVSSIGGIALKDGTEYWIGAVASDDWLNSDTGNVIVLSVTPDQDLIDTSTPPKRAIEIEAWDHPDDAGNEIDISFAPSTADDFSYYIIWVADTPVDNLEDTWARYENDLSNCGCLRLNKQWIDERWDPIQLTIGEALYGGEDPSEGSAKLIEPDIELFVTITIHDIKGNVYLTDLNSASVTPIDNTIDDTAPVRMEDLILDDREGDDGTAVILDFEPSTESDVDYYEVYAAGFSFDSVGIGGNGPVKPVAILERNPQLPLTISSLSDGSPVIPGMKVTTVVVVVDSSDNAHRDGLYSITTEALDDGGDPFGGDLPEIMVSLTWNDDDSITADWNHPTDPLLTVVGYRLYISDKEFTAVDDAILVEELPATSDSMILNEESFTLFNNETTWWIGVAVVSEFTHDHQIKSYSIAPDGTTTGGQTPKVEDDPTQFSDYLTTQNLLAGGLGLLSLILLLAILRGGGRRGGSRDKEWEIQEATWGVDIEPRSGWDDMGAVVSAPPMPEMPQIESTLRSGAQRIESQQTFSQQPTQQAPPPSNNSGIDTSFLDDLL